MLKVTKNNALLLKCIFPTLFIVRSIRMSYVANIIKRTNPQRRRKTVTW